MTSFSKYIAGVASVISVTATTSAQENKIGRQPNIVCIFTDDHAFQAIRAVPLKKSGIRMAEVSTIKG